MASVEDCAAALQDLAHRFGRVDEELRRRHVPARVVACTISDLDRTFVGRIDEDGIHDIAEGAPDDAQVRLTCSSDDLVAMVHGDLGLGTAWTRGRLHVEASIRDLLRLRSMLA